MKRLMLFEEYGNQWELILSNPEKRINGKKLIDLVNTAYSNTKYGSFVKTVKDVVKSDWYVIDCDADEGIDACIFFRKQRKDEKWEGKKIQGIGHDGSKEAKKYIIDKLIDVLKEKGTWVEASDKLEEILQHNGCQRITDVEILQKLFPKSKIKMLSDGRYQRTLSSGKYVIESTFGNPTIF